MTAIGSPGVQIRPATTDDVEAICRFLAPSFPGTSTAFWRGMLGYPWIPARDKSDYGEVIVDGRDVVGFFGAMYSDRDLNGRIERFCNVFSWFVLPEYRRHSIALVASLVRRPGLTFVNVTPASHVVPLFGRLGFTLTNEHRVICTPHATTVLSARSSHLRIVPQEEVTESLLGPAAFAIFQDHFGRTVRRTVVEAADGVCLLVTKRMYWSGVKYPRTDLYYASNRSFLARHFDQVLLRLLWADKTVALHADTSLLGFTPKASRQIAATALYPSATLFKSATVQAGDVDRLYSELVILP